MKLRHVRAVAVFVGVVVALTGARHSGGGGCDDSSNSSSSSSGSGGVSGGSTHYDDDDDYDTGSGSGGAEVTQSPVGEPTEDVRIEECKVADQGLVADVRATNSSSTTTYTYTFRVVFTDPNGKEFRTEQGGLPSVPAGSADSVSVVGGKAPAGDGFTVSGGECALRDAQRIAE